MLHRTHKRYQQRSTFNFIFALLYTRFSSLQKESITTKLQSLKHVKDAATRKEISENWKSPTLKSVDKTQGFEGNQVTEFGLKLKARNDQYIPLFEEYDE